MIYDNDNDTISSIPSHHNPSTRKVSSRIKKRSSVASLHTNGLSPDDDRVGGGGGGSGGFSLAHELAFALMPEPSAGSRLLAEELGIEYEEGAEGIDVDNPALHLHPPDDDDEEDEREDDRERPGDVDPAFAGYDQQTIDHEQPEQEIDSMQVLAQSLELTDKFILQLRSLDVDSSTNNTSHHQLSLETMASAIIRHIDETTRDREGQLRELLECEREFRRIAGEVGGEDVLGHLDQLDDLETEDIHPVPQSVHRRQISLSTPPLSPTSPNLQTSFTAASTSTVPHLTSLRTSTTSLISSLSLISEHAQVTGAATADAGRKIRALKNKIGGWRADMDLAEQSRIKIEKWEAEAEAGSAPVMSGRDAVQQHLKAFERAVADATIRTKAITVAT